MRALLPVRRTSPGGLSDRKVEVSLVAGGLPNRAIADSLWITPKTVEHHVQHIYDKLGVATRTGPRYSPRSTTSYITARSVHLGTLPRAASHSSLG
jgi:DNA-binding CsgD family transcriptional regulator